MTGGSQHPVPDEDALRTAARRGWDDYSSQYQAEHGDFLGDIRFVWCPEGLDEAEAALLGDVAGRRVLEVGCGAAQCTRWLLRQGADAMGVDVSSAQLRHGRELDARTGVTVATVLADAEQLPLRDVSVDIAFSAYGAVQFVADLPVLLDEVVRVLRPGGLWVFSVTHPVRWCFPDDPGPDGLVACLPYWNRRPYVELDEDGAPVYVEHHRTIGDYVRAIGSAGLVLDDVVEPEWPEGHDRDWDGWSAERGRVIPGTAVFCCHRPG